MEVKTVSNNNAELQVDVDKIAESESPLDAVLNSFRGPKDEVQRSKNKKLLADFVEQLVDGHLKSAELLKTIDERISEIDRLLSDQVSEILHHKKFQQLESSWRGLYKLVTSSDSSNTVKVKIINTNKNTLLKNFQAQGGDVQRSFLFKTVYEDSYGTLGGEPYGMLIGDYEYTAGAQDIELLKYISQVSACAHAPFISSVGAEFFGWDSFEENFNVHDLEKKFINDQTYAAWRSFRETEDSRYVGLCLPRTLIRAPYTAGVGSTQTFNFTEKVDGSDHDKYLWGNTAYYFGSRVTEAFATYGWCAKIRGIEGGGLVSDLPLHSYKSSNGDTQIKCPTEIQLTDRREVEYDKMGFIPLVWSKNSDYAAFMGAHSCNKPKIYSTDEATANADLSSKLEYMFVVSRIAHYFKSICRDKIGGFTTREGYERYLKDWLSNYINPSETASDEDKARCPLYAADVEVKEVPGAPGSYTAIAYVRPHYHTEEIDISLRLVTDLPKSNK
jgi:type VI secretion system protein ImpC